ncbi:MAG: immunoglobulin-like domain-containing protein [Bacteroidia bacterium]
MKKQFFSLTVLAFTSSILLFSGCTKDDTTSPVITLTGSNPLSLDMRTAYVEPGFSAADDQDGNLTSSVLVDKSALEANVPGTYEINYSVSDAAGNIGNATREVDVIAKNTALAASYSVHDDCGAGVTFDYVQTVGSTGTNKITFNKFADYSGNTGIYATIDPDGTITLPSQTATGIGSASETHTFGGSGQITANGFTLTYTDQNVSQGATATCVGTWTRQ